MKNKKIPTKIYLFDASKIKDPMEFDSWKKFLPEERWEKTVRPIKEEDRKTELAAWLLLYYVLKKWGVPEEQINAEGAYDYGVYGKPVRRDKKAHFNLSHSGKYVLCAVSDREIGCDIEKIRDVRWKVAKRFFSEKEYNFLEKMSENEKNTTENICAAEVQFTRYWVLRESYVKKTGEGLGTSLSGLDFSEVSGTEEEGGTRGKKEGKLLKESFFEREYDGYRIAVCEEKDSEPEFVVCTQKTQFFIMFR